MFSGRVISSCSINGHFLLLLLQIINEVRTRFWYITISIQHAVHSFCVLSTVVCCLVFFLLFLFWLPPWCLQTFLIFHTVQVHSCSRWYQTINDLSEICIILQIHPMATTQQELLSNVQYYMYVIFSFNQAMSSSFVKTVKDTKGVCIKRNSQKDGETIANHKGQINKQCLT